MKVQVNNKEVETTPGSTLTQLTAQLELPVQGIAIAVNNKMIPRTEWERFMLHENDNLVIIKAACGDNGMVSLQFITHQTERYSYLESARMALEGGCKWIQLRMKEAPLEEVEAVAPATEAALQGARSRLNSR